MTRNLKIELHFLTLIIAMNHRNVIKITIQVALPHKQHLLTGLDCAVSGVQYPCWISRLHGFPYAGAGVSDSRGEGAGARTDC